MPVDAGDWVRQGQVLAVIDRSVQSQQAQSAAAQIQVAQADAELRNASAHAQRTRDLQTQGFVSKAALDMADNQLSAAKAGREQATAGDSFETTVTPDQAYGERRDGFVQRVPKKHFRETRLQPGQQVVLGTNMGPRAVTVVKVGATVVDVDLNHPMAGKSLDFKVEILGVRAASEEEIAHGHAHGAHGHHH